MNKSFPTLDAAYRYANGLVAAGVEAHESRIFSDQFKKNKRDRLHALLGVKKKAGVECARLAPGGTWGVEVEMPGTEYQRAGILGPVDVSTKYHRFSAWYSKYLPYAYAMMHAENGFECRGVDFNSINAYYGTCMGYAYLGRGDVNRYGWKRIEPADVALYEKIVDESHRLKPPDLPFDAVYFPAICYVAAVRPDLAAKQFDEDHGHWQHACAVLEAIGRPRPVHEKASTRRA